MATNGMTVSGEGRGGAGRHVVVLGASMAGLLAARVLSERFEKVTLLERDPLPDTPTPRKGEPQANHLHLLMARGAQALEELFPGFIEELTAAGCIPTESTDMAWFHFGRWKLRTQTGVRFYNQSRGLLEWKIRQRVLALPNVEVLDGHEASGYLTNADQTAITGLKLRHPGAPETMLGDVDLVVDASGRGSQTARWLEALGYPRVEQTFVKTDVAYTSRLYHQPSNARAAWWQLAIYTEPPHGKRMGALIPVENGQWIVSLCGVLNDHAPTDEAGFLEFARGLPRPDIYEAIQNAEPASPLVIHKFPGSLRRHYERMARFPDRLVVLGDALCSLNPTYGQGMTVSALEALLLRDCLRASRPETLSRGAQRFRKQVASVLSVPWSMAVNEDLRYPQVEAPRPLGLGLMQWYTNQLHAVAAYDPVVVRTFMQVLHMVRSPLALFSPGMVWRVLSPCGAPPVPASQGKPSPTS